MNKKLLVIPTLMLVATVASAGIVSQASAADIGLGARLGIGVHNDGANTEVRADVNDTTGTATHISGIIGTVTTINGTTITVQSKAKGVGEPNPASNAPTITYTIQASGATVTKGDAASTLSAIAVGDTIMAQGTVSGTTVAATKINDGIMPKGHANNGNKNGIAIPNGNGQPIIGGKVTAVSGNTVTITNSSNVSYTIDVTNAKMTKNGTSSTASTIAVGDTLLAQGTINGTSVTAVNIVDSANATATVNGKTEVRAGGFFGAIGSFFSKLFGF